MIYAGIGAVETPEDVQKLMGRIAQSLALRGHILRSGGARGADTAFEQGCDAAGGQKIIYKADTAHSEAAMALAVLHHPMGEGLRNYPHRGYLIRDGYQIVGKKLAQPSDFVVCWTDDGSEGETTRKTGGTGQALRIAYSLGIPIFNLRNADSMPRLKAFLHRP